MRILIVEDEKRLADTIAEILARSKYLADLSYDGESGLDNALSGIYDAIILDVMLPGMDGFEILQKLRSEGVSTPVLMLTARAELSDRVAGLDCGADYYLTKPFETEELLACLRALTRRQSEIVPTDLSFGDLTLRLSGCELCCGTHSVLLGAKELEIMRILMANSKIVVPKETLLLKVWGSESDAAENNVEVYISFLRKKLAFIHSKVGISAVRRLGYHLEVNDR